MGNIDKLGTMIFWVRVYDGKWQRNSKKSWPTMQQAGFTVDITQNINNRLIIELTGIFEDHFKFNTKLPELRPIPKMPNEMGFSIALTWDFPKVKFFVNGKPIGQRISKTH